MVMTRAFGRVRPSIIISGRQEKKKKEVGNGGMGDVSGQAKN